MSCEMDYWGQGKKGNPALVSEVPWLAAKDFFIDSGERNDQACLNLGWWPRDTEETGQQIVCQKCNAKVQLRNNEVIKGISVRNERRRWIQKVIQWWYQEDPDAGKGEISVS